MFAELGFKDVVITNWYGMLAPATTPAAVVNLLSKEITRITQLAEVRERLNSAALEPLESTPTIFSDLISTELSKWEFIVREANIQTD